MRKFFLPVIFFLMTNVTLSQTIVPGGIVSGTWTAANSPYLVQGAIMVADGATLTIDPGVRVEFQGDYKFLVLGRILATGTPADTIVFTATDTSAGWLGIRFDSTLATNDTSKFFYCRFEYGKANGTSAIEDGGAFYFRNFSKAIINHCRITNCSANSRGGGIFCIDSSPVIVNNVITRNRSVDTGGGIFFDNGQPPILKNNLTSNWTTDQSGRGGAIGCYDCLGTFIDSNVFAGNLSYRGGAVFCSGQNNTSIIHNIFSGNSSSFGSGVCLEISNPLISQNSFSLNVGSIIYCEGVDPTVSYNNIFNNYGLAVICAINNGTSVPVIRHNIMHHNYGGVACYISSPVITENFITDNLAVKGAAIRCESSTIPPLISNNVIANNTADSLGGALYFVNSSPVLTNNTIANNAALTGGALYCNAGSDPAFNNTILWGNTASVSGNEVYLFDEPSDPIFTYCDVQGGSGAFAVNTNVFYLGAYTNNIDLDPLFMSPSAGSGLVYDGLAADWSLQAASPCIDAGNPSGSYPPADIAGNPRVTGTSIDMGAYESLSTGITDQDRNSEFIVSPNPSNGTFQLLLPADAAEKDVVIYDLMGKEVSATMHTIQSEFNFTLNTKGLYIVKVVSQGRASVVKLAVM